MDKIKLNIGSNAKRIKGFVNLDIQPLNDVDIVWDLENMPYPFDDGDVGEIFCEEVLEHLKFRNIPNIVKEWHRILKVGGRLHIQVPAIDKMCEMFTNKEICDCVLHKPKSFNDARGKDYCPKCKGKAKVHPDRWMFAFTGAGKNRFDFHLAVFTKEMLYNLLKASNFVKIKVDYDKYEWKLIANCYK